MNNSIIILISSSTGSRSGKDTVADYMFTKSIEMSDFFHPKKMLLSEPLKEICKNIFGLNDAQASGDRKEENLGWDIKDFAPASGRTIQQYLGTEVFRNSFYQDIWVECLERKMKEYIKICRYRGKYEIPLIFVPDWRFQNEFNFLYKKRYNVFTVDVIREEKRSGKFKHASENSILEGSYDYVIFNNFNLDELKKSSFKIMEEIFEKFGVREISCC